jgi:hypothetical protein
MVNWGHNAAILGEFLLIVLVWISAWGLIERPIDEYVKKFWVKMVIFAVLFIVASIFILVFADQFNLTGT